MKLARFFKVKNYKNTIELYLNIRKLNNLAPINVYLKNFWKICFINSKFESRNSIELSSCIIFGEKIALKDVNWHFDPISNFEYPKVRFNRIKLSKWFNKGIDVKFPWELSRFYFGVRLSQNFVATKDIHYYYDFKRLVVDWIENNRFCYGVNWTCAMEVAIRAINWIVAVQNFEEVFKEDLEFNSVLSKSLSQHAEYISLFPEIYETTQTKNHSTNHTTADYTGLLFIALALKNHAHSKKWLKQAITGLEDCIRYQTYEDGVNFEASIPYHRLTLEMFAYSAITSKTKGISFSSKYYELLFKMFEYSAAYMDHNGNAPQVGDNDSGRILILHDSKELEHSYLLDLGEHIFDFQFVSQCQKRNSEFKKWLPDIEKKSIRNLSITPRETDKSISFNNGGAYFLKNDNFSLMLACFPIGQNGIGGHNHFDIGSFTLSFKGQPIIVDPGTYTYTRDYKDRALFRSSQSHNCAIVRDKEVENSLFQVFGIEAKYECSILKFQDNKIEIEVSNLLIKQKFKRTFVLNKDSICIEDITDGPLSSYIHLSPDLSPIKDKMKVVLSKNIYLETDSFKNINIVNYKYSDNYDNYTSAEFFLIETEGNNKMEIKIYE